MRKGGASAAAHLIASGEVSPHSLRISLHRETLAARLELAPDHLDPALLDITAPFACRRRGVEMRIVAGERHPAPDSAMIRALQLAHRWAGMLKAGRQLKEIADREGFSESYVGRIIPIATLSPKIQVAIVTGSQPLELNLETLVRTRLPLDWSEQERRFGLSA